jgi:hypothetical protein
VLGDKGSFWWRDPLKLCDIYRGIAQCTIGNGSTIMFWLDIWNEQLLQQKHPRLYSYAKNKNTSVAQFLQNNRIEEQFHLPLSVQAYEEYQDLQHTIQLIQISTKDKDKWKYIWGVINTPRPSSTTQHTKTFNHQSLSSGFGTPTAIIR